MTVDLVLMNRIARIIMIIRCATCFLDYHSCPGHFGHVELNVPCYNPITFPLMFKLLRSTCLFCHSLCLSKIQVYVYCAKIRLLKAGMLVEASQIDSLITGDLEQSFESIKIIIDGWVGEALKSKPTLQTTLVNDAYRKMEKQFLRSLPTGKCQNCKGISPQLRNDGLVKIFQKPLSPKSVQANLGRNLVMEKLFQESKQADGEIYMTPIKAKAHLAKLWEKESKILNLLYGSNGSKKRESSPDMFFFHVMAVSPTKFRPISKMGDMMFEHPQNIYLVDIIKSNLMIIDIKMQEQAWLVSNAGADKKVKDEKSSVFSKKLIDAWVKLQESVNNLVDSSKAPAAAGKVAAPGIRQILEKKEGLFRKHMMGKRVNYAARSVISPDPYIETNEIGVCLKLI